MPRKWKVSVKQEEQFAGWLKDIEINRGLTYGMYRKIYYDLHESQEIFIIDFAVINSDVDYGGKDTICLTSPCFPTFALSTYESIKHAYSRCQEMGLQPRIHIYNPSREKH